MKYCINNQYIVESLEDVRPEHKSLVALLDAAMNDSGHAYIAGIGARLAFTNYNDTPYNISYIFHAL